VSWRRATIIPFGLVLVLVAMVIQPWSGGIEGSARASSTETEPAASSASPTSSVEEPAPAVDLTQVVRVDGAELPDPSVLTVDGGYVAVGTNITVGGVLLNVPLRASVDLLTWTAPFDAMPRLPAWAEAGQTWAPTLVERDGAYELWFSAIDRASGRQCIGVATATSAAGPFESTATEPVVCAPTLGGAIDPEIVVDGGTTFLLWKNDGNCCRREVRLWAQELAGTTPIGESVALLRADASWELGVIENPAVVRSGDVLVLLYSGGEWGSDSYGTGYATCVDLRTACQKRSRSGPVFADADGTWGSGGASTFASADGTTWLVWHAWSRDGAGRSMFLAPLST